MQCVRKGAPPQVRIETHCRLPQDGKMKRLRNLICCVLVVSVLGGCKRSSGSETAANAPTMPPLPTEAQPKLATIKLWIGPQEMITEMAVTQLQERTGMMFRTNMAENEGMIFVFPQPQQVSFWMMQTLLPLSAAYIAPDGTILEIHDLQPQNTNAVVASNYNIQYVLETKQGWFKRNNIGIGTVISTERGPLRKVFQQ
jgi:uncharacterized membrane protein (UPF0127 family)